MKLVRAFLLVLCAVTIGACTTTTNAPSTNTSGTFNYGVQAFRIRPRMVEEILDRHLETINALRTSQGLVALQYSPELTAAAQRHANDIFAQRRAWHFGTDGSSPLDRVSQAGFQGQLVGENLSETYEDDQVTLQAWLRDPNSRAIILDPAARSIGFAWFQEDNAKLWWVQIIGSASSEAVIASNAF